MKSPFPGMDPYLEMHWRDVHTSSMVYARDQLQDQLPGDLLARVEEGVSIDVGSGPRTVYPDVRVVEDLAESPWQPSAVATASVVVAEPVLVPVDDQLTERHVEIIDPESGNRVVTAIEVLSPSNKEPAEGRLAYRLKQHEYLTGGVNLVEVDLLRGSGFVLAYSPERLSPASGTVYHICIRRIRAPHVAAVYRAPLRQRLPIVGIPLRPTDKDVTLDLQQLIDLCYQRGRYWTIDYRQPLAPRLPDEDARWADELLREKGRR